MRTSLLVALSFSLVFAGCGRRSSTAAVRVESPRLVSILVEVYDPFTNYVWQDASVRIVEADQEWSGVTHLSPYDDYYLTDANGRVLLDEYALADASVGFFTDRDGAAVLSPARSEDEATVVLEISGDGFLPVIVEVPLRWSQPDVFVEVPFY